MRIQMRAGVFETNSSSTHSLVICTADEYAKFKSGDMVLDTWSDRLVSRDEAKSEWNERRYENIDHAFNGYWVEGEFYEEFETPSGDNMVVFGAYGRDG